MFKKKITAKSKKHFRKKYFHFRKNNWSLKFKTECKRVHFGIYITLYTLRCKSATCITFRLFCSYFHLNMLFFFFFNIVIFEKMKLFAFAKFLIEENFLLLKYSKFGC